MWSFNDNLLNNKLIWVIIGILVGVLSSASFSYINFRIQVSTSFLYLILIQGTIIFSIMFYRIRAGSIDVFSPFLIPNLLFILIYVLKPIYIIITGEIGVGEFNTHYISTYDLKYINITLFYSLIGIFFYNLTLHLALMKNSKITNNVKSKFVLQVSNLLKGKRLYIIIIITSITTLFILAWLIISAGGYQNYILQLSLRNELLKGKGYILLIANAAKITLYYYFLKVICDNSIIKKNKILLSILFTIVLAFMFLTGGRSTLLYGLIVLVILRHYVVKKFTISKSAIWGLLAFFFIVIVYRVVLRDIYFGANQGFTITEILINALTNFPRYFFGGYDVIQFDALFVVVKENTFTTPLLGETIKSAILSPMPSSIYPDKQYGAMTYFTKNYFPEFYYPNKVELNISLFGELFLNFRIIGIILGAGILALLLAFLYKKVIKAENIILLLVYSITIVRVISLIRGDIFNFITFYIQDIFFVILLGMILKFQTHVRKTVQFKYPHYK